jgi:hypothetical protein
MKMILVRKCTNKKNKLMETFTISLFPHHVPTKEIRRPLDNGDKVTSGGLKKKNKIKYFPTRINTKLSPRQAG